MTFQDLKPKTKTPPRPSQPSLDELLHKVNPSQTAPSPQILASLQNFGHCFHSAMFSLPEITAISDVWEEYGKSDLLLPSLSVLLFH